MKKIIYTLFLSLISLFSFAQSTLITGRVVIDDAVDGQEALQDILVENEKTNAKVYTNNEGMFSINVSVGDQLNFSNDFYEERSVKISKNMLNKGFIIIHLNIDVVELAEANVNNLDRNWKNNIKDKKSEETLLNESLGLDPNFKNPKIEVNTASLLNKNGALDPTQWVSMISGQKKKENKRDEYFNEINKIKNIQNFFTNSYFTERLTIPENKVTEFITYCFNNFGVEKLADKHKYEKIDEIFKDQAPAYLEKISKNN